MPYFVYGTVLYFHCGIRGKRKFFSLRWSLGHFALWRFVPPGPRTVGCEGRYTSASFLSRQTVRRSRRDFESFSFLTVFFTCSTFLYKWDLEQKKGGSVRTHFWPTTDDTHVSPPEREVRSGGGEMLSTDGDVDCDRCRENLMRKVRLGSGGGNVTCDTFH